MIENLHRSTTPHVFEPPTGANGAMNASSEIIHHCLACSHYGLISYMGMSDEKQHFGDKHLLTSGDGARLAHVSGMGFYVEHMELLK